MTAEPVQLAPEVEVLALAELAKRVAKRYTLAKALVGQSYPDGRRETFRSPLDGTRLGMVYRTDPDPQWRIADREALEDELRQYPGNVETVVEIAATEAEVAAVLADHAPHLLVDRVVLREDAVLAALDQSAATGKPAAAGIEQVKPSGVLTPKPDAKTAGPAIERMVAAGLLTWDMRPALPAAEADPAGAVEALHRQGPRPGGGWGCLGCDWVQDRPHAEHVADMAAQDGAA